MSNPLDDRERVPILQEGIRRLVQLIDGLLDASHGDIGLDSVALDDYHAAVAVSDPGNCTDTNAAGRGLTRWAFPHLELDSEMACLMAWYFAMPNGDERNRIRQTILELADGGPK